MSSPDFMKRFRSRFIVAGQRDGRRKRKEAFRLSALEQLENRVTPANISWIGASGANWSATSSWQGGVVPGSGDIAVFDSTSPGTVNVDLPQTVGGILISNTAATPFVISGSSLNLELGTITLSGSTPATIAVAQIIDA